MNYKVQSVLLIVLASYAGTAIANTTARNAAMGGAGVASSNYDAASTANPALLTEFGEDDDAALIVPSLGLVVSDEDDLLDTLDGVVDSVDLLESQIDALDPNAIATGELIISDLQGIDGVPATSNLHGLVSFSNPGKKFGWAIGLQAGVDLGAIANYEPADEAVIVDAILSGDSGLLEELDSSGIVLGASVTELTFSAAREFKLGGTRLSVGVTPKFQRVDTILYEADVNSFDSDEFDAGRYTRDDSNFNLDIGLAWFLTDRISLGLMVRDVIENDYSTVDLEGDSAVYRVETGATAGIAWNGPVVTLAADIDLLKRRPFSHVVIGGEAIDTDGTLLDEVQFARLGLEFNAFDWMQVRAGFRHDLAGTRDDMFTAGLGFSPFGTVRFDLTGAYGENDTYGVAAQLSFTF